MVPNRLTHHQLLQTPSVLPTMCPTKRKPPTIRNNEKVEYKNLLEKDKTSYFEHLNESRAPKDIFCNKQKNHFVYYILVFDSDTGFSDVSRSINVDQSLHVQRKYMNLNFT